MADTYEKDLAQKSSLTTSDYIRVVGSDNVSYKQSISSVMSTIGLSVTSPTAPTLTQTEGASTPSITQYKAYGKMRFMTLKLTLTAAVNAGSNAFTGTLSEHPACSASSVGYAVSTAYVLSINTSGGVTVRAIGANASSGAEPYISISYVVA